MALPFKELVESFEKIEQTASRNEMTEILRTLYESLSLDEVQIVSYMLRGRVAPSFIPAEFNYSEKSILNFLKGTSKVDVEAVRSRTGDIGLAAQEVIDDKSSGMAIVDVYEHLWSIINATGSGSTERKSAIVSNCLMSMSKLECKYFARIVSGNLRLGASVKTLLDAFSLSLVGDKSKRDLLDHAYGVSTDIGFIAKLVYGKNPEKELSALSVQPGTPVNSRLVERAKTFEEVFERLGESFYIQPKYDGLRCQIHKSSKGFDSSYSDRIWHEKFESLDSEGSLFSQNAAVVRLFTRNLEDVTEMFPEIIEAAKKLPGESFILDSEIIGWDEGHETFKSYQDTMTRRRKYGVSNVRQDVPVRAFLFDVLYLNGKSLVESDTEERLRVLERVGTDKVESLTISESIEVKKVPELQENFDRWVEMGLEGLIAKTRKGGYTPGVRNFEWIKMKKSMDKKLVDSVDLVVLGYYFGSGKRAEFGLGSILGGVYNPAEERYESVTSIGTGITDDMFKAISKKLKKLESSSQPKGVLVEDVLKPDVWVHPEVVITVEADEITRAINNKAVRPAKGLSLRFPRLIEFDRDKGPEDATSVEELENMFELSRK